MSERSNTALIIATYQDMQTHYEHLVRLQTPEWERQYSTITTPGIAHRLLMPAMFEDPAVVTSCMLLSLSQLIATRRATQPIPPRIIYGILQLRGHVMRIINEALDDPRRANSDHLIIAVLLLATCEALHGLRESYPVHMIGCMNMVNLRGGLSALGMQGLVEAWSTSHLFVLVVSWTANHNTCSPLARRQCSQNCGWPRFPPSCEKS